MRYRLHSTGKVIAGRDEAGVVAALQQVTGLSETDIREKLLNGHPRKLVSGDDRDEVEQLQQRLRQAGLEVEMVMEQAESLAQPGNPAPGISHRNGTTRRLLAVFGLLLVLVAGAGGYGWYWLQTPSGDGITYEEAAMADGRLVAIGHADVAKILTLRKQWLGELDPAALPLGEEQGELMKTLFSGRANFADNLQHLLFAIHGDGETKVATTLLLLGRFDAAAIVQALQHDYLVQPLGQDRWSLLARPRGSGGVTCPLPAEESGKRPQPGYLQIGPQRMVIASSQEQLERVYERLAQGSSAGQELGHWRAFRRGQLASAMLFIPQEAGKAVDGLPGMMARRALEERPNIGSVAARVGVAPLGGGVLAGIRVESDDAAWNRESAAAIRQRLAEWSRQGGAVSPSLAKLLSRIAVAQTAQQLELELDMDGEMLAEAGDSLREAVAGLFSATLSPASGEQGPVEERIDTMVVDYGANTGLAILPPYRAPEHMPEPLLVQGSFAANLEEIRRNDEGLFEVKITGAVALPKVEFGVQRAGEVTLWIDDVRAANGESMLRDERCLQGHVWMGYNHEPRSNTMLQSDSASVEKRVRLKQGAQADDVAAISGRLAFTAPLAVKRIALPFETGASAEYRGLRFYINQAKAPDSVSYQLSGAKERMVELRALNAAGKPLQRSWSMGSEESGRMTRSFRGTIHSLELYVAERTVEKSLSFTLEEPLAVPVQAKQDDKRHWFAPRAVPAAEWERYAELDLSRLHEDPEDAQWHRWERHGESIATLRAPPLTIHFRQPLQEWDKRPQAEIYYPMLDDLPGVLSLFSYQLEQPAGEEGAVERFVPLHYPYYSGGAHNGEVVVQHQIDGLPFARTTTRLQAEVEKGERLSQLKGVFRFRLPTATRSERLSLDELWPGREVDGITVTLSEIGRGMFPGYGLKLEGAIERLVNLHGIGPDGQRIPASPVNFQSGGYWTMTLPFTTGMQGIELVLAAEQRRYEYPFDIRPQDTNGPS